MCELIREAVWAAEEIADRLGVPVRKALNPLDNDDFLSICVRLAGSLRGAVAGTEAAAMKAALDSLDVDWPNLSAAGRDRIIAAARAEVRGLASTVPEIVEPVFATSAATLVGNTRRATVLRFAFDKQLVNEAPADRRVVEALPGNTMVYVKDQYGARSDALDALAQQVVASGLERGLGRDDISEELHQKLRESGVVRTDNYWNIIASDFANKARTSTQLTTYERAGIVRYRFDAILDEATSEICRLLHGRVFSVKKAVDRMRSALSLDDPEKIRQVRPWVQPGVDSDGNAILYYDRGGGRRVVAQVDEPAEGQRDRVGRYSRVISDKALEAAGVTVPPLHGHCRSTIVTDE